MSFSRRFPLYVGLVLLADLALLIWITVEFGGWWTLLAIAVGWIMGIVLVLAAGQQVAVRGRALADALRGRPGTARRIGRPAYTLLSALLFFLPGLLTDVIGLALLITPVQDAIIRRLGWENRVAMPSPMRRREILQGEVIDPGETTAAEPDDRPRPGGSQRA